MNSVKDKVVVVTGGSAGIGKATVIKFATLGARVAIWDVATERGQKLAEDLSAETADVKFFKVDTSDHDDVTLALKGTLDAYGRIDVLINNAGITRDATLVKMTDEQWDQVIDINLKGVFYCTRAVAPSMIQNGFGRIINTSSVVGLYGNFGQTNYSATKAGVIAMTKTWAKELGRKGINVNAVAPGFILTEMVQAMPAEVLAKMSEKVPSNKLGTPEDIANVYAFLASDQSDYINGATISVDGGIHL